MNGVQENQNVRDKYLDSLASTPANEEAIRYSPKPSESGFRLETDGSPAPSREQYGQDAVRRIMASRRNTAVDRILRGAYSLGFDGANKKYASQQDVESRYRMQLNYAKRMGVSAEDFDAAVRLGRYRGSNTVSRTKLTGDRMNDDMNRLSVALHNRRVASDSRPTMMQRAAASIERASDRTGYNRKDFASVKDLSNIRRTILASAFSPSDEGGVYSASDPSEYERMAEAFGWSNVKFGKSDSLSIAYKPLNDLGGSLRVTLAKKSRDGTIGEPLSSYIITPAMAAAMGLQIRDGNTLSVYRQARPSRGSVIFRR